MQCMMGDAEWMEQRSDSVRVTRTYIHSTHTYEIRPKRARGVKGARACVD